jgi:hypothetical protein
MSVLWVFLAVAGIVVSVIIITSEDEDHPDMDIHGLEEFSKLINFEIARISRGGDPFSLLYLGLNSGTLQDYQVNLATLLSKYIRCSDQVGIIDDDIICMFFPATDEISLRRVISRLSNEIYVNPYITSIVATTCNGRGSFGGMNSHLVGILSELRINGRKTAFAPWGPHANPVRFGVF